MSLIVKFLLWVLLVSGLFGVVLAAMLGVSYPSYVYGQLGFTWTSFWHCGTGSVDVDVAGFERSGHEYGVFLVDSFGNGSWNMVVTRSGSDSCVVWYGGGVSVDSSVVGSVVGVVDRGDTLDAVVASGEVASSDGVNVYSFDWSSAFWDGGSNDDDYDGAVGACSFSSSESYVLRRWGDVSRVVDLSDDSVVMVTGREVSSGAGLSWMLLWLLVMLLRLMV